MSLSVAMFWVLGSVCAMLAGVAFVRRLLVRGGNAKAGVASIQADTCKTCVHWDQPEGQAELRANPIFANAVAPHVSPARMMQRFTPEGEMLPVAVKVKASEDNWTMFGKCNADTDRDVCTHCSYTCSRFAKKG